MIDEFERFYAVTFVNKSTHTTVTLPDARTIKNACADYGIDFPSIEKTARLAPEGTGELRIDVQQRRIYDEGARDGFMAGQAEMAMKTSSITVAGDELAAAAAQVCSEYDGVHRLRAKLSKWFNVRAGVHGTE